MQPYFGDIDYAFAFGSPPVAANPLPLAALPTAVPFRSHGIEAALLATEKGVLVPFEAFFGVDPLVISLRTRENLIYDWILTRQLRNQTVVKDPEGLYLTIPYGDALVVRTMPHTGVRDVFKSHASSFFEVDVPIVPGNTHDAIEFQFRIEDSFIISEPETELISHRGGAVIRYTGLESTLEISDAILDAEPNAIHMGFYPVFKDSNRQVSLLKSFPVGPLRHRITQAVMYDGRTVRDLGNAN